MIRLTPEQVAEAERHPEGLRVEADGTDKTFVLVEESVLRRLQPPIEQGDIHESLKRAFEDIEAGRTLTLEEVDAGVRAELGLPPRETA